MFSIMADRDEKRKKPGPKPDSLHIDGDWEDAIKEALGKKKPKDGWPDHKKGDSEQE